MSLIIIDMQEYFNDTASVALKGVLEEIAEAKAKQRHIFVVEYWFRGEPLSCTLQEIEDALEGYPKVHHVAKTRDNGGHEVLAAIKDAGIRPRRLRFCGVNRGACVVATVTQIRTDRPNLALETSVKGSYGDGAFARESLYKLEKISTLVNHETRERC